MEFNEQKAEGIVNPVSSNDVAETHTFNNKRSKWKFIIGGLFVVVAIAVGLFVGYNKIYGNPINIYKNTINSVYKMLSDNLKEVEKNEFKVDLLEEPITLGLNVKLDSEMPELKNFSGIDYNLQMGLDVKNEKINVNLGAMENNKDIIKALYSFIDGNIYFKCEQLFDKVLYGKYDVFADLDFKELKDILKDLEINEFDYETYDYILKELKNILIDSLDKNKFKMSNEKITIADKKQNVKKVVYVVDEENAIRTSKFIINEILKNDELIDALVKCSGVKKEELINYLNKSLAEVDNIDMDNSTSNIVLYVNNLNVVVAGSVITKNEEVLKFECAKDLKITVKKGNDKVIIEEEQDFYTYRFQSGSEELMTGKIYKLEDSFKVEFTIRDNEEENLNLGLEFKDIKNSKDEVSLNIIIDFDMVIFDEEIDFKLDMDYSLRKGEIETVNPIGSVSVDSLTETEMLETYTKLEEILSKFGLEEIMDSM